MESKDAQERAPSRRPPLGDATTRVNNSQRPMQQNENSIISPATRLPHHDSLKPDGNLQTINPSVSTTRVSPSKVENKRLSAITRDSHPSSNRDSQISTTSTTSGGKSRRKTHVGPWQLGKTLGKGATGRVRLAKHAVTGQTAAVKIVSKRSAALVQSASMVNMDEKLMAASSGKGGRLMPFGIEREVVIMKLIEHPNITNLYDVWENRGELYLVLEYVEGGELFEHITNHGPLAEQEAVRVFRQIIAGLSYCHRFNICHRDLKPENILLDRHHNVKIADFGMAALQPAGHWLNTSCGSPHYASPEIIKGRKYQGDRADIWSCGIILFVLLVGALPFDGQDLQSTLSLVKRGEYFIPPGIGSEASDLIQRILRKRPEDRITMDEIWKHPLLRKYEAMHQISSPDGHYVGPPPPLSAKDAGRVVTRPADIDNELLRNLHTLWHGEKQEVLIQRLLDEEPNYEKLFYHALVKFREEQLENYPGPSLDYSTSDYHHVARSIPKSVTLRQLQTQARNHNRRRSQFSILSEDNLRTKDNHYRAPSSAHTIESYDPYRSSRKQMVNGTADYANVTILRHGSDASRGRPRHPAVDRLQFEEVGMDANGAASKRNSMRTTTSKSSIASSRRSIGPSGPRRSTSYKRQVIFQHHKTRSSGHPARHSNPLPLPSSPDLHAARSHDILRPVNEIPLSSDRYSSPALSTPPATIRSRKPVSTGSYAEAAGARPRPPSQWWKDEARKVSTELEKFCEEAFNRTSQSPRTTGRDQEGNYESSRMAASAYQKSSKATNQVVVSRKESSSKNRPLPEPPLEQLDSFTVRQLAETRSRLLDASLRRGEEGLPDYLSNVITQLDRLLQSELMPLENDGSKRASSDPHPRLPIDPGYLPAITEERLPSSQENLNWAVHGQNPQRAISEPGPSSSVRPPARLGHRSEQNTIRIVPPEPSPSFIEPTKPLNIRKMSIEQLGVSQQRSQSGYYSSTRRYTQDRGNEDPVGPYYGETEARDSGFIRYYPMVPIQEEEGSPKRKSNLRQSGDSRKWNIFKRNTQNTDEAPPTPPMKDVANLRTSRTRGSSGSSQDKKRNSGANSANSDHGSDKDAGKVNKFLRFFTKAKEIEKLPPELTLGINEDDFDDNSTQPDDSMSMGGPRRPGSVVSRLTQQPRRDIQVNQNWFARFFKVKPATRVLSLNVSKLRARREVVRILRDWKRYGMKDIHVDRMRNLIFGRVDADNYLQLRPVNFAAELFTVVEYGRRANLSLVRFTQEKGAASSFHKVVDTLQEVLAKRNVLVENGNRAKKMANLLQ